MPEPQRHGSFRPILACIVAATGVATASPSRCRATCNCTIVSRNTAGARSSNALISRLSRSLSLRATAISSDSRATASAAPMVSPYARQISGRRAIASANPSIHNSHSTSPLRSSISKIGCGLPRPRSRTISLQRAVTASTNHWTSSGSSNGGPLPSSTPQMPCNHSACGIGSGQSSTPVRNPSSSVSSIGSSSGRSASASSRRRSLEGSGFMRCRGRSC